MRVAMIDRLRSFPLATVIWPVRRLILAAVVLGSVGVLLPTLLAIKLATDIDVAGPPSLRPLLSDDGPRSLRALLSDFEQRGYELPAVLAGRATAPRLFVTGLPVDWPDLSEAEARKRAFVMVVLPLVLRANEEILAQRARVSNLAQRLTAGQSLPRGDRRWLAALASDHGIAAQSFLSGAPAPATLQALLRRLDVVPASLAVAQAAVESGWGTSRFALDGKALYGQWSEEADGGIVPAGRDEGRTYVIKRFRSLSDSVAAYMRNLNTHRAYRNFRAARAAQRRNGKPIEGLALATYLRSYSARGAKYVKTLESIITVNGLDALDRARLEQT